MIATADPRSGRVRDALSSTAWSVEQTGGATWRLASGSGALPSVSARMIGGWLELESTALTARPGLALLARNLELGGLAKYASAPAMGTLHLRAELPLEADADLSARVHETLQGIASAARDSAHSGKDDEHGVARATSPAPEAEPSLADLCRAAAWPFVEREAGRLAVDLGLRDLFPRARVERLPADGAVRVSAEIEALPPFPSEICRRALATFLLRAGAIVRLVRPFVKPAQGHLRVGVEATFTTPPSPRELDRALSALAVACQLSGREVAVLGRDETIARAYLALDE